MGIFFNSSCENSDQKFLTRTEVETNLAITGHKDLPATLTISADYSLPQFMRACYNRVFHKLTKLAISTLLPNLYYHYLQFPALFTIHDVSKYEIRNQ